MITTINASPKKNGTVGRLLKVFESEAKKLRVETKRVDLYDYRFPPHTGNLKRWPLRYPFIKDIRKSDGMVIATPTYWFNVPGQLKNFIDVLTEYINWDKADVLLEDKMLGVLAVAPGGGATNVLENLAFTLNTMGMTIPPYALMFFGSQDQPENPNGWCRKHIRELATCFEDYNATPTERRGKMKKAVSLNQNPDGTWTARIFSTTYTGTYEECRSWLQSNGESV